MAKQKFERTKPHCVNALMLGNPDGPGSPLARGRTDLGTFPGYCMIAPSPVSVFRLAMVLPFMHLQPCGGPRGRRKRFRRSVAQWLEHRSPKPGVGGSSPSTPARRSSARSPKSRQRNGLWPHPEMAASKLYGEDQSV